MSQEEPTKNQEIIIVRRSNKGDSGEHHGGAWKIAYADFVTAMMAFFLVMWLISVTAEDTKNSIANYFNPIKFSEVGDNPLSKNLNEEKVEDVSVVSDKENKKNVNLESDSSALNKVPAKEESFISEEKMFLNPYKTLNDIANGRKDSVNGGNDIKEPFLNSKKGDAFRDFVIPEYSMAKNQASQNIGRAIDDAKNDQLLEDSLKTLGEGRSVIASNEFMNQNPSSTESSDATNGNSKISEKQKTWLDKTQKELEKSIEESKKSFANNTKIPNISFQKEGDKIAISMTDKENFDMFDIGSAKPNKQLIEFLNIFSKTLKTIKGKIVIRGFTDARPYKNAHYDNWQLSSSRAQMIYYILRRAGISENRINSIEGYADRKLKNPKFPNAAENRRIEILIAPENS